ncbi:hypothetical protein HJC23_013186 [Cyclotella cryptica]|uniref:Guanylate cyclase domain-containing protein n=1 Tax=Cyclotella cryptica TaxID=29204 RepID=A0ABD3QC47_9STRA
MAKTNKSSRGLFSKLRSSGATGNVAPPSPVRREPTARQNNRPISQSYIVPRNTAALVESRSQSYTHRRAQKEEASINDLTRQHFLLQRELKVLKQQQQLASQQSHPSHDMESPVDRSTLLHDQPTRISRQQHQNRNESARNIGRAKSMPVPESSAARALANLSLGAQNPGSQSATENSRPRRKGSLSVDNDTSFAGGVFESFYSGEAMGSSVMAQQPPPPDRRQVHYSKPAPPDQYATSLPTQGNPSRFSGETTSSLSRRGSILKNSGETGIKNYYIGSNSSFKRDDFSDLFREDSTTSRSSSTLTTAKAVSNMPTNQPSKSNATASSLKAEKSMSTLRPVHTNNMSLVPYREDFIDEAEEMNIAKDDVTIVFASVQGSATLWEACPDDMMEAHDIYDFIMRLCCADHNGFEISSEGATFHLAFQSPVDALAFALQAQVQLYDAQWPESLRQQDDSKDEPALKFRGLRVRMGVHQGEVMAQMNEATGRTVYFGEGVDVAKSVESMCHGGQILTTVETWSAASGMRERSLGRPQVLDCGKHFLFEMKVPIQGSSGYLYSTKKVSKGLIQLVPHDLAFDFGAARGRTDPVESCEVTIKSASSVFGRLFPPVSSKKQLSVSFLNAPYANGRVTLCVVYAVGIDESDPNSRVNNLSILSKHVKKQLLQLNPPGYDCKADGGQWLLAFDRMANAVMFGLQLNATLHELTGLTGQVDIECMFKVGIVSGPFTSMSPNPVTGKAEYFGPIVNRTVVVANNCKQGQVCVGIPLKDGDTADPPDFGASVRVELVELKKMPNVKNCIAIFECKKRNIDMPYK